MPFLVLSAAVLTGFLTLTMAFYYFSRVTFLGFGKWTIGAGLVAAGYVMIALRGVMPASLAIVIQNFLFPLAAVFYLGGTRTFLGLSDISHKWYLLPLVNGLFAAATVCWFDSAAWRTVTVAFAFSVPHLATSYIIFKDYSKTRSVFSLVLGTEMVSTSALLVGWAVYSFTVPDFGVLMATPAHAGFFISLMVLQIVITVAFLMLNAERFSQELLMAKDALKFSEEKYSKAFHGTPDAIIITRITDGKIVEVNEAFSLLTGYSKSEALEGSTVALNVWANPQDRDRVVAWLREQQSVRDYEANFRTKSGKRLDCLYSGEIILLGSEVHVLSVVRDITERKRHEEALKKSEEKYRRIVDTANEGIWEMEASHVTTFVNPKMAQMLGYSMEEMIGQRVEHFMFAEDLQDHETKMESRHRGKGDVYERRFRRKDGTALWTRVSASPILDQMGSFTGSFAMLTDITERREMEEALRQSEERFRFVMEATNDGVWDWDMCADEVYRSPEFFKMLGYRPEDFPLGLGGWKECIHPDDISKTLSALDDFLSGRTDRYEVEFRMLHADGKPVRILSRGDIVARNNDGKPTRMVGTHTDVTERKKLEAQLVQSQKMQALGTLAAGIAHDFNNMLQVIMGYADLLLLEKKKGAPGYHELQRIVRTAEDARDLVQKIRVYSRQADIQPILLDLNNSIREIENQLRQTLPSSINIETHLTKNLSTINADPRLMNQMVMNLSANAAEAMPGGGLLIIETQNIMLDKDFCQRYPLLEPGLHALLTISDTGLGIASEHLDRLFDPFYSTKVRDYHKGTGLGLPFVQGIVELHKGFIDLSSKVGKGTTVKVYLPATKTPQAHEAEEELPVPPGGTETILLVEDEEIVRNLCRDTLEQFGYKVLAVTDGQEALKVYQGEKENISLVILDIIMPRMDGRQCLPELLKLNPGARVLVSSGVAEEDVIKNLVSLGAKDSILKPFNLGDLLRKVREVLDAS